MIVKALLTAFPLFCFLASLGYAVVQGLRAYESKGRLSILGVAATLLGLLAGRMADRFIPLSDTLYNWVNYSSPNGEQVNTSDVRYLDTFSVETAIAFLFVAVIGYLAIAVIRGDAGDGPRPGPPGRGFGLLAGMFGSAAILTAHAKIAVCVTFLLAKAHLL